jgi:ABC-type nickel/cobalt efflux system permease component RcnA
MVIIPFLVVLFIATIYFQRALNSDRLSRVLRVATMVLMSVTAYDLWQHMRAWRVTTAVNAFPVTAVDLSIKVVGNHPDAPYVQLIAIGAIISLATGIFLINRTLNERRKQTSKIVI